MNKETTKMIPGDELHLTMLMAPYSLNLVTGQDRQHLLAFGRAAFDAGKADRPAQCLHQITEQGAHIPDDKQIKALMRKHRIWIEHSTLLEDGEPERELRAVQAEEHQFNAFVQDLIAATQPAAQGMDAQQYRLIEHGELIEAGDQFLRDDFCTWEIDPNGIFVGTRYGAALRPARRALAAQAKQGGA